MAGTDGLVIAHVLIDSQCDLMLFAQSDNFDSFTAIGAEGFLSEDPGELMGCIESSSDDVCLTVRRDSHIQYLNIRLCDNFFHGTADCGDLPAAGNSGGLTVRSGGDGNGAQSVLGVSGEVAVGHDESGADTADADGAVLWQLWLNGLQNPECELILWLRGHGLGGCVV